MSELKRYVLFDNNFITDTTKLEDDDFLMGIIKRNHKGDIDNIVRTIKKESDSLLDLVEVGDLIECEYHKESTRGDKWIEKPIYNVISISNDYFHLPVFSLEKDHEFIVAIWKRKGDKFQRYEIEKELEKWKNQ